MASIGHVVVLMLENRSFDSLLGRLYPGRADFDGLRGSEFNRAFGRDIPAWCAADGASDFSSPDPDPQERFVDMTAQIYGSAGVPGRDAPTMGGFAENYGQVAGNDPKAAMHGYRPHETRALSTLARAFAVSDRWHASAPNQTWPNRFFVHCGTAGGYVDNSPPHFPYGMETVFNQLDDAGCTSHVYFHDVPQAATLSRLWAGRADRCLPFAEFLEAAASGTLPHYSFIEPRYFADPVLRHLPNDQHPPHDIRYGEMLIADIYQALRAGPGWKQTLWFILYDEHGGLYDHVAPPPAVPPDGLHSDGFAFDRYGVRVPAVLVSPWVAAGSIIRPPPGSAAPFDHTSVIATLQALFGLGTPLTARVAAAPTVLPVLSRNPDNDGPAQLDVPRITPSDDDLARVVGAPANAQQAALASVRRAPPNALEEIAHTVGSALDDARAAFERLRKEGA